MSSLLDWQFIFLAAEWPCDALSLLYSLVMLSIKAQIVKILCENTEMSGIMQRAKHYCVHLTPRALSSQ